MTGSLVYTAVRVIISPRNGEIKYCDDADYILAISSRYYDAGSDSDLP